VSAALPDPNKHLSADLALSTMVAPHLAMVAGEASGDLLASLVLRSLMQQQNVYAAGIGGPQMAAQGFQAWWPSQTLAVRGYAEVLRHLPRILRVRRQLRARLKEAPPRVFMGVDAPDFNLGLEAELRRAGVPTVHFVSPSIWAWRKERVKQIRESVGHMLCVFPFEPEHYEGTGVKATYVGHPLADVIPLAPDREQARAKLVIANETQMVALLPGSREAEIRYLLPLFLEAALIMCAKDKLLRYVLPVAHIGLKPQIQALLAKYPALNVQLTEGGSHEALAACDGVMVASGTATLEAALFKRPMVVAYRMPRTSWWLLKNKNYLPHISLPNILCNEALVPELVQDACTPQALAAAMHTQLNNMHQRELLTERFTALHHSLRLGCAERVADVLRTYL
jgi:lipid-A-disaccharide synthase